MAQTDPQLLASTKQQTFGEIYVNSFDGDMRCDKVIGFDENGNPKRCENTAQVTIRRVGDPAEFYCKTHTKDDWLNMVNNEG